MPRSGSLHVMRTTGNAGIGVIDAVLGRDLGGQGLARVSHGSAVDGLVRKPFSARAGVGGHEPQAHVARVKRWPKLVHRDD